MTELGYPQQFDKDISSIIAEYLVEKPIKFKDYILNNIESLYNNHVLYLHQICANGEKIYIDYLYDNYKEYIDWPSLCQNHNAIHILKENKDKLKINLVRNKHPNSVELLHEYYLNNKYLLTNMDCFNLCAFAKMETITMLKNNPHFVNSWVYLSKNPNVLDLLLSNPGAINWLNFLTLPSNQRITEFIDKYHHLIPNDTIYMLSRRNDTLDLLERKPYLIRWPILSSNTHPKAINILENNKNKIVWKYFSSNTNPRAIEIMENNISRVVWESVLENVDQNENIIEFVDKYQDIIIKEVDMMLISSSCNAINIIENNIDKVDWIELCYNTHPKAMEILENNLDKVSWSGLSFNKKALDIKNRYLHKLTSISKKELMFEVDHNKYNHLKKAYTKIIYNM